MITKSPKKTQNIDVEAIKRWKKTSTKAKLDWLEAALKFGKLKKF
jgi:hypothetical protein